MTLVIEKKQINDWVQEIRTKFVVIAPHRKDNEVSFIKVGEKSKITLGYKRTLMPPKQYFLPAKEETFKFNLKKKKIFTIKPPKNFVIFGLNYPDLEALTYLDEIMKKPKEDFFYWQKRKKATLIGIVNKTMKALPGGDMVLEKINEKQYRALILTKKGSQIAKSKFFKEIKNPRIKNYPVKLPKLKEMLLDSELIAEAVAWSWKGDPEIWNDLAKQCLGCGICTYVCPLCYCFSNEDRVSLDNKEATRCRYWDACTLPGFANIAGGYNFHGTLKERYYNWFYHKFVRGYKEYGKSLCVACGRCQKYCPAGIDIRKVLKKILKDYLKSKR